MAELLILLVMAAMVVLFVGFLDNPDTDIESTNFLRRNNS